MTLSERDWLQRIHTLAPTQPFRIMNVCGGHERAITMAGLRSLLPVTLVLIPGPGCPVCVCPEEDIHLAIQLALRPNVILVAFGDLLRVPVNVPRAEAGSLEAARSAGADVRPIASPFEAVKTARAHPDRQVVFFAAGFETTMAPVAALLSAGVPDNLSVLLCGRLTWPIVAQLLETGPPGFDALIAPGHVATVMGPEQWRFVPDVHGLPAAVAGFTPVSLLAAMHSTLCQHQTGRCVLDNCYPEVAHPQGNRTARDLLNQVMQIETANWRGIGPVPDSGFGLRPAFAGHDARRRFQELESASRQRAGEMPPGCDCAKVVLGQIRPNECRLYGRACHPRHPIGPCMVSDEGACRIWWTSGVREQTRQPPSKATP